MSKKVFFWHVLWIILAIWQLPQLLVGLVMLPFLGKLKLVGDRHYNLCFAADKMKGGISLGPLAFVERGYENNEAVISHELDGHTFDSKVFGPLYLFIIGLPSIIWAATYNWKKHCYYDFYTERLANKHAGLIVDEYCRLKKVA